MAGNSFSGFKLSRIVKAESYFWGSLFSSEKTKKDSFF